VHAAGPPETSDNIKPKTLKLLNEQKPIEKEKYQMQRPVVILTLIQGNPGNESEVGKKILAQYNKKRSGSR
jgi:hypothetical protein